MGPALLRQEASRPAISQGTASGDVTLGKAVVWSRTDRRARMHVEWSTTESFQDVNRTTVTTGPATDFTARAELVNLPAGQRIFYRVHFEDLNDSRNSSIPATGTFLSAPRSLATSHSHGRLIRLVKDGASTLSGADCECTRRCGARSRISSFIAATPSTRTARFQLEVTLPDGMIWKNLVTPAKSKAPETLADYRGNYLYNLLDDNVRRFNTRDPAVRSLGRPRGAEQLVSVEPRAFPGACVAAQGARSSSTTRFAQRPAPRLPIYRSISYGPQLEVFALDLRTYRAANSGTVNQNQAARQRSRDGGRSTGSNARCSASTSAWKVIASDLPIGLVVADGPNAFEAFANGDGPPLGREHEIAELLRFIRDRDIRNVMWVTGDVHYAAAHHYHPDRAQFKDFNPFWEFVAGPLHAGTFGPNALDNTFGPEVRFSSVPAGMTPNQPPSAGLQFFGFVRIAATNECDDGGTAESCRRADLRSGAGAEL